MEPAKKICLVVPCFNEEQILDETIEQLLGKLKDLETKRLATPDSLILLVDDGSGDSTWSIIEKWHRTHPAAVDGLKLSANKGHQNALLAGLLTAKDLADAVISLDADLQDDIDVMDQFIQEFQLGNDIVYGVRSDRSTDSPFKRLSAEGFYWLMARLGVKTVYNHADYRLMSQRALEALSQYQEVNLYMRGLIPLLGFRHSVVFYKRKRSPRPTHYPLGKMLLLAWDGITSFSIRPIRMISVLGLVTLLIEFGLILRFLYVKFFGYTVSGWTSLMMVVLLFSGVQLLSIGVIGEYIAKTYVEVKRRPRFYIQTHLKEMDSIHED